MGREAFLAAREACPGTSFQASEASSYPPLEASSCPEASFQWEGQDEMRPPLRVHRARQERQERQELQTHEEASFQAASFREASYREASYREASFPD